MRLDCQVAALSAGVVKRQIEFDEKAQSLSAMVSPTYLPPFCCKLLPAPPEVCMGMPYTNQGFIHTAEHTSTYVLSRPSRRAAVSCKRPAKTPIVKQLGCAIEYI